MPDPWLAFQLVALPLAQDCATSKHLSCARNNVSVDKFCIAARKRVKLSTPSMDLGQKKKTFQTPVYAETEKQKQPKCTSNLTIFTTSAEFFFSQTLQWVTWVVISWRLCIIAPLSEVTQGPWTDGTQCAFRALPLECWPGWSNASLSPCTQRASRCHANSPA